mgnify:CR=1 FL=1
MAFFKEFKQFALKGNVMDMAVGVIIGGAFGKIVSSFVNDILMPPIGALIGNTDFSQLRLDISKLRDATSHAVQAVGDVVAAGDAHIEAGAREQFVQPHDVFIDIARDAGDVVAQHRAVDDDGVQTSSSLSQWEQSRSSRCQSCMRRAQ